MRIVVEAFLIGAESISQIRVIVNLGDAGFISRGRRVFGDSFAAQSRGSF